MVEADYRMKLVGMGLEDGVPGVKSYLASIELPPARPRRRWACCVGGSRSTTTPSRPARTARRSPFAGQGVKVLSENERLSAEGQQIHTGESDELNRQFAHDFTEHFPELASSTRSTASCGTCSTWPWRRRSSAKKAWPDKVGWHLTCFGDPQAYAVALGEAPKQVERWPIAA